MQRNEHPQAPIWPYFANLALINVLRVNTTASTLTRVQAYLDWYIRNTNDDGTIYDYNVTANGDEVSTKVYDSTDAYAGTFLSLVKRYLDASGNRSWVTSNAANINKVANATWLTYNPDLNLTYAQPGYKAYYTMDNVEVWKGLDDYSQLLADMDDSTYEHYYYRAELIRNGLYYNLWNSERNEYQVGLSWLINELMTNDNFYDIGCIQRSTTTN